ncbi:hypothetical protein D3C85_878520 [compost metagenome]
MSEAAYQHLAGLLLGQLRFFLGDAQQAVAWVYFQQQQGGAIAQDRCHGIVDGQGLAGQGGEHRFTLGERVRLLDGLAQGVQGFGRLGKQLTDELAVAALAADGQEHFRSRVHVLKPQFGIEQNGRGGQVVE